MTIDLNELKAILDRVADDEEAAWKVIEAAGALIEVAEAAQALTEAMSLAPTPLNITEFTALTRLEQALAPFKEPA